MSTWPDAGDDGRLAARADTIVVTTGRHVSLAAAMAELAASESGLQTSLAAASVFGARGYVTEYETERNVRDAVGGLVHSGTSDIQRNIIARLLGVG